MSVYKKLNNKEGVTLVELMVAVFVLGLGLSGLFSGFIQAQKLAQVSIYQNIAVSIANSYVEQLKSVEFTALENNPITNLVSEGESTNLSVSPTPTDVMIGSSVTDVPNIFTIDSNNSPDNPADDMVLRIILYLDDMTDETNEVDESRMITIRYEVDYFVYGQVNTFSNVIRTIRSDIPTF